MKVITPSKEAAVLGRMLTMIAAALALAAQCGDALARGSHGGHSGGHAARAVIFAAPIVYLARPYYAPAYYPPASYYPPATYYPPVQPAAYNPPQPPLAYAPPPLAPAGNADVPSPAPLYVCKDDGGRTTLTNRKEDTVGKYCMERSTRASSPPGAAKGPYAIENATRYRYFCPDSRKYYPEVNICAAWLKVVPDIATTRR